MAKATDTKTKPTAKKSTTKKAAVKKTAVKKVEVPKVDPKVELYQKEAKLYRSKYNALLVVIAILIAIITMLACYRFV